ncbi:response regulator transcription factor [Clostridium vincentii]|uniref:Stage 0 sporulation protein A homolog n=1 Tax=Clostridium vincentii TaxID=52704 RepID=A0A2T0B6I8_9CLOT|nr:response regulator transcription factor [Clostridium vincentii]PRR79500.1 Transcriptional regulatory protein SrrA [Clostridium vincentii]
MKGKILIVEDEKKLTEVMRLYLEKEGYEVKIALDGRKGEEAINEGEYDLIILDIMMPEKDGWSVLRKIKNEGETPVILTSARGEEEDRIFGLELGAVDYMVKPISMEELVLRVSLRIKKCTGELSGNIAFEDIIISDSKRTVSENGVEINLTPKEFDLLLFLCKSPEQVFNREQLLNKVWAYDFVGDTRTIDTHIKNLREKIKYCEKHIKTVWGVGYKLQMKID